MEHVRVERIEGPGPRVLLLPGLGARGEGYRRLAELLAPHASPLLVEYPAGRHAGVGAGRLAEQVLDATGPVEAVVASSMAGLVAAHLAGRGAVQGIAFLGSFCALEQLGLRAPLLRLMGPIATLGRPGALAASIAAWQPVSWARAPEIVPTTSTERWSVWHRALAVPRDAPPPSLKSLDLSCVAIHGDRDALVPVGVLKKLKHALPEGSPVHVLKGAGHVPYWSHADEVASLLRPWLEEVAARAGQVRAAG